MNKNPSFVQPVPLAVMAIVCLGLTSSLRAQIVTYGLGTADSFDSPTVPSTLNVGNISASALSATGVLRLNVDIGANGHFLWANWEPTSTVNPNDKYYSFTIAPSAGFQISFSSIGYSIAALQTSTWQLRSSVDGYSSNFGVHTDSTPGTAAMDRFTDDVTSIPAQTGPVTFRLYGYNHTGNGDDFDGLANNALFFGGSGGHLAIAGTVSAVPEPRQYAALVGLGLLSFAAYRQRNRL